MNPFSYDFMQHAFIAGTLAALIAAVMGYFVVLRQQTFAGHALGHVGFTGAAGAGLIGLTPMYGQLWLTLLAALGMGLLSERAQKSDVAIGIVLAFALALGMLFLYFYNAYAAQAISILFGDLLGVSSDNLQQLALFSGVSLLGIGVIGRRLLFATIEPELAEARGVSLRGLSVIFLLLVAIAVTEATTVIGVLLIFTLLVAPPAAAIRLSTTFWRGLTLSVAFGLTATWLGILLAFYTNWPITFWISTLSLLIYVGSLFRRA